MFSIFYIEKKKGVMDIVMVKQIKRGRVKPIPFLVFIFVLNFKCFNVLEVYQSHFTF